MQHKVGREKNWGKIVKITEKKSIIKTISTTHKSIEFFKN